MLVDKLFLEERQHAGRAGTDGHACKNGERDTEHLTCKLQIKHYVIIKI